MSPMWPFNGQEKPKSPPAMTEQDEKIYHLLMRIEDLENHIADLEEALALHIQRIDHNVVMLDKNMHNLASLTLRPPKDLLGGNQEPN